MYIDVVWMRISNQVVFSIPSLCNVIVAAKYETIWNLLRNEMIEKRPNIWNSGNWKN